jgi:hypothetical protein
VPPAWPPAQRRRLAGEVITWFSGQLDTTAEPITRLSDLMSRTADGTPGWRAQVAQLVDYRPDLADAFGSAVLAAHAAPLPATQCRTCYAVMLAEMTDAALPVPDAATRALLGELCPRCLGVLRAAASSGCPRHLPVSAALLPRRGQRHVRSRPGTARRPAARAS